MKNIIFSILFLALSLSAAGQAITEQRSLVKVDTNFFVRTLTISDFGTGLPDTAVNYQFLGDSLTALNKIYQVYSARISYIHAGVNRAFQIKDVRKEIVSYNSLYQDITGSDNLVDKANETLIGHYGAYEVNDTLHSEYLIGLQDGSTTFARMVRFANNSYRLRKTTGRGGPDVTPVNSNQYVITPRSEKAFEITVSGTTYSFWLDENVRNQNYDAYRPLNYISGLNGTPIQYIVKFKNTSQ